MHQLEDLDPEGTVEWAIAFGRQATGRSLRQIAAISGISSGQISRLASGKSNNPSLETTHALAPALGISPVLLMVLAGHLTGIDAERELGGLLDRAAPSLATEYGPDYVDQLRADLNKAAETGDRGLKLFAAHLFTHPVHEVDFPTGLAPLTAGRLPDAGLLDEFIRAWPVLTPERRWRLLEVARDLASVSELETNQGERNV